MNRDAEPICSTLPGSSRPSRLSLVSALIGWRWPEPHPEGASWSDIVRCRMCFMRIAIVTMGSRGDLQPYVALGAGLRRPGHAVTIATHSTFASLVATHELDFRPLGGDPSALLASREGRRWVGAKTP